MGNGGQQSALPLMPKLAPQITLAPPPWTLRGEGIMLLYRFKKTWVESKSNLPAQLQGHFKGGFGYVMLVDYKQLPNRSSLQGADFYPRPIWKKEVSIHHPHSGKLGSKHRPE